jgi:hypothetical protein
VGARSAEIWSLVQEANRLDDATTHLVTKSMLVDKDAPHRHYPMLRCNAKEAEWFCKALAFVWPQYCDQTNPVHRHISQTLRLVLSLLRHCWDSHWLAPCARGQGAHIENCSAPDCPLQVAGQVGTIPRPEALEHSAQTPLCWALGTASAVAPLQSMWPITGMRTSWAASSVCPRRQVGVAWCTPPPLYCRSGAGAHGLVGNPCIPVL